MNNKLIEELTDQCREEFRVGYAEYETTFDEQMFARLIIQECINVLDPSNDPLTSLGEEGGRRHSMYLIKNHFGIGK